MRIPKGKKLIPAASMVCTPPTTQLMVRHGRKGAQLASLREGFAGGCPVKVWVWKWSRNSKQWTKTVRPVMIGEILGFLVDE